MNRINNNKNKVFNFKHFIFSIIAVFGLVLVCTSLNADSYAYAATSNESGTAVVITTDGKVIDYGTDIRGAWEYCDRHQKSTMKLTSDLKLNDNFSTGGRTYNTDIIFDFNGHTIDCQNRTNAFNLFKNGGLKIIDSSASKAGRIINGKAVYGGAIKTMGRLDIDDITIENCRATEPLAGGGAIYAWVIDVWIVALNEPHMFLNNCTIKNCVGYCGGAIEVHADNLIPSLSSTSALERSFSNSGTAALKAAQTQVGGLGWTSGASIKISNSTITGCSATASGGALNILGEATLDNTTISNCSAAYGAGAINIDEGSTLKMFNSTITGCTVDDGNGGAVYIQYGLGGESRKVPGHAEIFGGAITNNKADDGSGIYFPSGHGGSSLKIGGELIVKDNYDKSGKPDNIEMEDIKIKFFDEGLYGKADVGVGTSEKGSELIVGSTISQEVATVTADHMSADHLKGKYNQKGQEEEIGIYSKVNETNVYIGPSRYMELVDFQLKDRPNVKAEINRENREITVRFPFSEGIGTEGAWPEPVRIIWRSGKGGTVHMSEGSQGQPGQKYDETSKYNDNSVTTFKKSTFAKDSIVFECNGGMQVWTVNFVNEGETRCRVRVVNGSIPGHIPERESGDTKDYNIVIGQEVEIVADEPYEGECFDYWGYVCRGITPYYEFNDRYSARTKIVAPASSSKMAGLVFTACYTDIANVTVINGTHTDGTTVKDFKPGEHVKVTANTTLENFDHWEVVSGKLSLTEAQAKSRVLEFNMGYTDYDEPTSGKYGNITVKAVALSVEKPVANPGSGKYTGSQKVSLSCPTESSVIYYSLNGSDYVKYDNAISLTVAEEELQRDYTLDCYSVLVDKEGRELVASDVATYKYTIMNPMPKTACILKVVNGKTAGGKTEDICKPGETVTVNADKAPTGKYFSKWIVTAGKLNLTDEQSASKNLTFVMPNCDVTIEAVYDGTQILPHKATAIKGTLNGLASTYVFEGSKVTAAASPTGGMTFDKWVANKGITLTEAQEKSPVFTFDMPGNEVELEATFVSTPIDPHTLTVTNGYLENDASRTSGSYRPDVNVAVTAKYLGPANSTEYKFNHWEVVKAPAGFELSEVQKKSESIIITMPNGEVELKAVFDELHYSDNVYVIRGTIGETSDWMKSFNKGDTVTVSANAGGGITFERWIAYGVNLSTEQKTTAHNMSFTMPDNPVILIADYSSTPTTINELITINGCNYATDGPEGTSQRGTYGSGDPVTAKAVNPGAAAGKSDDYKFIEWVVISGPSGFELTDPTQETMNITMPSGDVVLKAVYAKKYATKVVHGSISVVDAVGGSAGVGETPTVVGAGATEGSAFEGDVLEASADTAGGMMFDHWESNGIKLTETQRYSSSFEAVMPASDIILEAVYKSSKIEPHTLVVEHGEFVNSVSKKLESGLLSGNKLMSGLLSTNILTSSEGSYYAGSKIIVKPDFAAGMTFDHWVADGLELTEEESHQAQLTITMPDNDAALTAVYRKDGVVPYILSIDGGSISFPKNYTKVADNSALFYQGCKIEVTAADKDGWTFDHWDADGITLTATDRKAAKVTITMPGNDVKLVAVYTKNGTDTGDHNNVVLYVLLGVIAVMSAGVVIAFKK